MCLLLIAHRMIPNTPVFLAANREESFARPATEPRVVFEDAGADWFGGRDRVAGGTWLGVNRNALVVGITNRRDRSTPVNPRSRGLLCREILQCESFETAVEEVNRQLKNHEFAGFNLLVASREKAVVVEHKAVSNPGGGWGRSAAEPPDAANAGGSDTARRVVWSTPATPDREAVLKLPLGKSTDRHNLNPGLHVLSNTGLNDRTDLRAVRAKREFQPFLNEHGDSLAPLVAAAETTCGLTESDGQPAICLLDPHWGTVSSTVISLPIDSSSAIYHYAAGPPCTAPFSSYSKSLREFLSNLR